MSALSEIVLPLLSLGLGLSNAGVSDPTGLESPLTCYEAFAQSYIRLPSDSLFLRPALRVSYERSSDEEVPQSIFIREETTRLMGEISFLYNGYLVPSVTLHGGLARRSRALVTATPISNVSQHGLTATELLPQGGFAIGVGIPIAEGLVIIEPFYRIFRLRDDARQSTQWGADVSVAVGGAPDPTLSKNRTSGK